MIYNFGLIIRVGIIGHVLAQELAASNRLAAARSRCIELAKLNAEVAKSRHKHITETDKETE